MLPFDTCTISTKQTFSYSQFVSFFGKLGTTLGAYDGVDFLSKNLTVAIHQRQNTVQFHGVFVYLSTGRASYKRRLFIGTYSPDLPPIHQTFSAYVQNGAEID